MTPRHLFFPMIFNAMYILSASYEYLLAIEDERDDQLLPAVDGY